ncbi:hypothetical protein [Reyranella sp.]|uniref:hypothetical protein n=1 Tax=Reyranella sp. TaxID=1929291 RepID=UPI003BAD78F4
MTIIGRPTLYEPALCDQAHNYCLLGATNDDLAAFFDVAPCTIDRWIARHPDFGDAVRRGRVVADARVARSLFERAVGYDRTFERSVVIGGELKPVTSTVHYPANVQACVFWLRNRRRRSWSDPGRDAPDGPSAHPIDDIALLDAAGESMRHHDGD